jgi:catechol 2,3-dioxygenase-like lactoylglutathione lyase family enzyme
MTPIALTLTHVWLLVDDMPRALGFYRDTLGLGVASDLGVFVELNASEEVLLSLFDRDAMRASEPGIAISPVSGQHATIVFAVAALDEVCTSLRAKGVSFVGEETNHPEWGLRTVFLQDPDGNLLCLYSGIPQE